LRSVLKRVEEVTNALKELNVKNIKLINIKIAKNNPDTGGFKLRAIIEEHTFIDVYEFLLAGKIVRYSYTLVKNNKSVLRYDNAPHHPKIVTHPNHKHANGKILELRNPHIEAFISEVKNIN